jgi:Ran GTPase-activating protein (RanGAP) involved in mRNA processing and transport
MQSRGCAGHAWVWARGLSVSHVVRQLVERYADVFGRGPDVGGVDKAGTARFSGGGGGGLAGEGGAGAELSTVSAALYFEKHHYRVLSRAEALAARVHYDGHVRALSSSGGSRPAGAGAEAAPEQGLPQVQCECAPWFTLRFPRAKSVRNADAAAVNAAAAAAEARREDSSHSIAWRSDGLRSASRGPSTADWPPSVRPSVLPAHFRFFQDGAGARAAAGAGVGELLRRMFRAKCKDLGIKPIAEQEAGFIERAQKGLSEEHFRLSDLGVGAAVVPPLTEILAAPECLVTCLDLSNNPLRDAGGAALARLLPRCGELRRLELRSVGLGDAGVAALFEGMRKDSLTSLDLGCAGTFGRNSLGVLGAEAAAKLLAQTSSLSWLSLSSTAVTPECATLLSKGLRQNLTLRVLDLSENQISDAGASNLLTAAISADLRELNLGHNEISDRSAPHFIALLDSVRVSLEKLDLRGNKLSNHASAAIATSLSMKNTSLSTLILDGNELGPLGAASLAKGLTMEETCTLDSGMKVEIQMKYPRSLTTLRLSHNELKDEGASNLCTILTKNWTLTALDLSNNMLTDAGARAVGKSILKNTSLVNLSLSWNLIGDVGIDALAQNLRTHEYLNSLSIEANKFSGKGCVAIIDMLSTCSSLFSLKFDYNEVTYDHSEAIKSLLDKNAKNMEANYTLKMKNEILLLSQKLDRFPELEAKLKSEERALKNRNDAIKDLKSRMLESRAAVVLKISEFDEKQNVAGERLKQIALNMKNADLKIR